MMEVASYYYNDQLKSYYSRHIGNTSQCRERVSGVSAYYCPKCDKEFKTKQIRPRCPDCDYGHPYRGRRSAIV